MAKRSESRSARRSKLSTSGITSYKPVVGKRTTPMPPDHPRSDGGKKAARKIPKAVPTPKPTADKSKRKPNKVKPIENDHSKPNSKPAKKAPSKSVTTTEPSKQVATRKTTQPTNTASSGKSVSVKDYVKRSLNLSSPTGKGRATSKVGAMLAVGAFVADKVFGHGAKSRTERNARIKVRESKAGAGKASFIEDQPTSKYKYNQNTRPKAFDKPNTPSSKFGMPPKKPTSPARKTSIDTESYAGASKVTGASAAPAPKPLNKPAGTKNTPDMFSQFMSNLTGVKVTPNNSKGPVKHDSNGTTASNQTGGALFGLIKDKKKKGSK